MSTSDQKPRPHRSRRRIVIAAAVTGALLIGAGTYATLLDVTANDDSAGMGAVPECQPVSEPLQVQADDPVYDDTAGGFVTKGITISNINANCRNAQLGLYATAFDVNNRVLKSLGPNLIGDEASVHIDFSTSGGVSLQEIEGWGFAIHPIGLSAPSNLVAEAASSTSVSLAWTAPSAPAGYEITDYTVEHSSDDGQTWAPFDHPTSTDPNLTLTGLTAGETYRFRVTSENNAGTGASATSSQVHLAAPGQVSDLLAAAASSTSVHLTWTAPTAVPGAAVTDYTIEFSPDGEAWTTFKETLDNSAF